MSLTTKEKKMIKVIIADSLRAKFTTYSRAKKTVMPFHTRMLGKDRMALFSFIQSLNTTFGTAIYEPVAAALAEQQFAQVIRGKKSNGIISKGAQDAINTIKNGLERGDFAPSQQEEMNRLRAVCQEGDAVRVNLRRADIYLIDNNGRHYTIEMKTAKPNIDGFEKCKENMLKWAASILYDNPEAGISGMLGIPYNPYEPAPYRHWTIRGMIEIGTQIKVGEEFWDFLAGKPVYNDLLGCFEEVGVEMRQEIDTYFAQF